MSALACNLPLSAALRSAADTLARASIPAVLYKGQDYLARIYGDPGARPMADADLLVSRRDVPRACSALLDAGFVLDERCEQLHECKFVKAGVAIDVHWELLARPRMRIPYAELFARARPSPVNAGLLAFEATDAFLVHCVVQTVKGLCVPASSYIELQALFDASDIELALARAHSTSRSTRLVSAGRVSTMICAISAAVRVPFTSSQTAAPTSFKSNMCSPCSSNSTTSPVSSSSCVVALCFLGTHISAGIGIGGAAHCDSSARPATAAATRARCSAPRRSERAAICAGSCPSAPSAMSAAYSALVARQARPSWRRSPSTV